MHWNEIYVVSRSDPSPPRVPASQILHSCTTVKVLSQAKSSQINSFIRVEAWRELLEGWGPVAPPQKGGRGTADDTWHGPGSGGQWGAGPHRRPPAGQADSQTRGVRAQRRGVGDGKGGARPIGLDPGPRQTGTRTTPFFTDPPPGGGVSDRVLGQRGNDWVTTTLSNTNLPVFLFWKTNQSLPLGVGHSEKL